MAFFFQFQIAKHKQGRSSVCHKNNQIDEEKENDYGTKTILLLTSNLHIFPQLMLKMRSELVRT